MLLNAYVYLQLIVSPLVIVQKDGYVVQKRNVQKISELQNRLKQLVKLKLRKLKRRKKNNVKLS